MNIRARAVLVAVLCSGVASAQTAQLKITAQTLSKQTSSAMFGNIPKSVDVIAIQFCNQTPEAQVVPLSRVLQVAHTTQGVTILPQQAAISLLSSKQSKGWLNSFSMYGSASARTIGDLKLMGILTLSTPVGAALVTGSTVFDAIKRNFDPLLQLHQYLILATSMPPDPLRFAPAGCTPTYYALAEKDKTAQTFDFNVPVTPTK